MQHMAIGGSRSLDKRWGGGGGLGRLTTPGEKEGGWPQKSHCMAQSDRHVALEVDFLLAFMTIKRAQVRFIPFLYRLNSFINLVPCTLEGTPGMGEFHRQFTVWETTWRKCLWITICRFYERVFYLPCQVPLGNETISFGPPSKAEQQTLSQ